MSKADTHPIPAEPRAPQANIVATPVCTYRLGRHPRRTDHPALLKSDGTLAGTFHLDATRQEIAGILRTQGLVLHRDDTVTPADADLIAACAEFERLHEEIGGIYAEQISEEEAKRRAEPLEEREDKLLSRMAAMKATTPAGILARARALAAHNRGGEFSFDHPQTTAGQLLGNLLRDAAGLVGECAA